MAKKIKPPKRKPNKKLKSASPMLSRLGDLGSDVTVLRAIRDVLREQQGVSAVEQLAKALVVAARAELDELLGPETETLNTTGKGGLE